jgi:hypothetical protein
VDYRETALLACAVMVFICLIGVAQVLQNSVSLPSGWPNVRRLYRANRTKGMCLVPILLGLFSFGLWRALLFWGPADPKLIAYMCETLVLLTVLAGGIITYNMRLESERFRQAGEKLERFIQDMKAPSGLSAEEMDYRILEARLTALELKELMGRTPSDDTWLGENGESQFK